MGRLTPKQEAFCREYMIDLNGTRAAIRAGYSERSAKMTAGRMMTNDDVLERIAELKAARGAASSMNAKAVLDELIGLLSLDAADLVDEHNNPLPMHRWPKKWRQFIVGFEVKEQGEAMISKFKLPDRVRVIELIGKHIGVNAFDLRTQDENGKKLANVQKAWALYQAGAMTLDEYKAAFEAINNGD